MLILAMKRALPKYISLVVGLTGLYYRFLIYGVQVRTKLSSLS